MWLADVSTNLDESNVAYRGPGPTFRSSSPPLEGGESLCEFYVDCASSRENEVASAGSNRDASTGHLRAEDVLQNPEDRLPNKNLFSFLGQELPPNTFTQTFLKGILTSVDSHDPVVANAWVETLLDVIDLLPKEIIKNEILTLAVNKGQMSQPVSSRLLCCRLLGKLCTKFDPYIIKKEVLPVVLSLCQDLDHEVRGCMCRQLDIVAKGIGLEAAKSAILPELVELSNDEESFVRLAAIKTVVQMLPVLDDETCTQAIIPLVQKFCEKAIQAEDSTLPVVAKELGRLCQGLSANLTATQRSWFLSYFQNLARLGLAGGMKSPAIPGYFTPMPDLVPELENKDRLTECRHACAYNFPAMVVFAGPDQFTPDLNKTFSSLCSDPSPSVKTTMAHGFYEIVKLLNNNSPVIMLDLASLLSSDSLEVLKGLIPHLPGILNIIFNPEGAALLTLEIHTMQLVQALISCEVTVSISSNWRLHANLLTEFSCLSQCLDEDLLYKHFVPLLLIKLYNARAIPCRMAAAYSLLVFLRQMDPEERKGIIEKLIKDLCYGKSCHKRMLFIKVCDLVLELFSKAFFKRHFFKPVLNLCGDRVPNIRLKMCTILPQLKGLVKLPKDGALLQSLESCVRNLMTNEKDRDVAAAVSQAIAELDKIEVPTEPATRRFSMDVESNLEDMRKEEEENRLTNMECSAGAFNESHPATSSSAKSSPRHGKIPVRKSGTLPKSAKAKEFKSSTLTRGSSQFNSLPSSKTPKYFKLGDVSSPFYLKDNLKGDSPVRTFLYKSNKMSPVKSLGRLTSPYTQQLLQRPDQVLVSLPTRLLDRCPSPMPPYEPIDDNHTVVQPSSLSTQGNDTSRSILKPTPIYRKSAQNSGTAAQNESVEVKKPGTPLPSPGTSRRISSALSRIPMPSSK